MSLTHERLAALLREQAPSARPALPADFGARVQARIEAPRVRQPLWRSWQLAAAATALLTTGVWLAWRPRAASELPAQAQALLVEQHTFDRLASATGLREIESLARSSKALFTNELESPIRSELAAIASDARRTADVLFAGLSRPVERLLAGRNAR